MAVKVIDSWALMAFLNDEPAAERVESLLVEADAGSLELLLTTVNWGEIYYSIMRAISQEAAEQKTTEMKELPIELVPVGVDLALARQAAIYKATRKMAYADCFAAALAKMRNVELVTGDPEFAAVENEITVEWLPTGP